MDPSSWVWNPGHCTCAVDGRIVVRPSQCEMGHPPYWCVFLFFARALDPLPRAKVTYLASITLPLIARSIVMRDRCTSSYTTCGTFLSVSFPRSCPLLPHATTHGLAMAALRCPCPSLPCSNFASLQNLWLRTLRHLLQVDPGLPFQTFPSKGEIERKDVGADPKRTWTIRSTDVMACEGARMRRGEADESQTTERS